MAPIVILHRVVPHYRVELFRRLHKRLGAIVACSGNAPVGTGLQTTIDEEFIKLFDFKFFSQNPYRCIVPLTDILRELNPVGIISEFSLSMSSTWQLAAMRSIGRDPKVMFLTHGPNYERFSDTKTNRLLQRVRIALLKSADLNICYTAGGKRYLARFIPEDRLFVANNTLPAKFNPMYEPRNSLAPVILSLGRMTLDKNFPLLITAFRHFHVHFSQAKLVIIGSGPNYERCVEMAGDLVNRSVFLPGAVYDEATLAKYFNEADLFVMAGAAGLSVNHALFYGLPVMIFRRTKDGPHHHPEAEYVVDGCTGWQVEPYSSDGLAAALIKVFSGKSAPRCELKESIRAFVETEISFENMVENVVRASSALLSTGRGPAK